MKNVKAFLQRLKSLIEGFRNLPKTIKNLPEKVREHKTFVTVLAVAIGVNIVFIGAFAALEFHTKDITVTLNGKSVDYRTMTGTVGELFDKLGIKPDKKDEITPSLDYKLDDGANIDIKTFETAEEVIEESIPFETKKEYTAELVEGESRVKTKGEKGVDKVTYRIEYLGGEEQSRQEVHRKTIKRPVTKIVQEGTAVAYEGVRYSKKLTVVATGYTHTGNRTATGTWPKRGTMAVDRNTIKMGSYGYVPGYGSVHAEDTGGAVKGNRIDLFFETRAEAIRWGKRTVVIYIK